jgi:DMSO/TMAO reductase YedYZ molybdopterin-dependent catalytic subunit
LYSLVRVERRQSTWQNLIVDTLACLPTFSPTAADRERAGHGRIRVDGLVAHPMELTTAELGRLQRGVLEEAFTCEEGWSVPGLIWAGVRLSDMLALAEPLPSARYVRAASGAWVVPIALADAVRGLVCDELNREPLTIEHGGPWRLVVSGGPCYTSVKWLDHLEVVADPGEDDARRIALDRLR